MEISSSDFNPFHGGQLRLADSTAVVTGESRWKEPTDIIAILSLVMHFDIPQIELGPSTGMYPLPGQPDNTYMAYTLGTGRTSHVEVHAMRDDMSEVPLRKGDLVALKRYARPDANREEVSQELYRTIHQELRIFCHSILRAHENICSLLFVGWEEHTANPVLALELADFGTLRDFLWAEDLRPLGPLAAHLVLDIAAGLSALHDSGIVHGDVKTDNILVFEHPHRRAVAKLMDFEGSVILDDVKDTWFGVGGTTVWRAPECYGQSKYDLTETDVYSFGFVAMAVLAAGYYPTKSGELGDCFLDRLSLSMETEESRMEFLMQTKKDPEDTVLELANAWIDTNSTSTSCCKVLRIIVAASLRFDPDARQDMAFMVALLQDYLSALLGVAL